LANVIEYAVTVAGRETILPEDLPEELKRSPVGSEAAEGTISQAGWSASINGPEAQFEDAEAARIRSVLDANQWKRAEAARALGISRATLWRRMRELNLA
jgi:propionate catabolism operon transcriptional regulator